jgi:hypothetical protein
MAEAASVRPHGGRRELMFAGVVSLAAAVLVGVLVAFLDARLDAATLGLAVACAALLYALRGMFLVVRALAGPDVELLLAGTSAADRANVELRDEKRRVLRAIKELDFDFGVGKLSRNDYDGIREAYQLRAVEVMRELEGATDLHPSLRAALTRLERVEDDAAAPAPAAGPGSASTSVPACPACAGTNDADAKFCKHCGVALKGAP